MNPSTRFDFDPVAANYDQWYATALGKRYDVLEKRAIDRILGAGTGKGAS